MRDFDLFVIGGGSGGVRCARIAAGLGARVGIAEARFWGGTCVNVGCVPKKLLVQAAEYGVAACDARGFGWNVREAGNDWAILRHRVQAQTTRIAGSYAETLENAGAQRFDAYAKFIDPHTLEVGGRRITADRIVIAAGGHSDLPNFEGAALGHGSDDAFTLPDRPRRITVLGGGYIGVEFAGIFAGLGSEVDLIYRQPWPLRGFDDELRESLAETLAAEGVRLHPTRSIAKLEQDGEALRVTCNDGNTHMTDWVLCATGRRPATENLGLAAAGVRLDADGTIPVDAHCRTNIDHIYAVGDVLKGANLTPVALAQGHTLAEFLFGTGQRDWNLHTIPTAVFSRPPIATVGPTEAEAARHGLVEVFAAHFTPLRHKLTGRTHHRSCIKLIVDHATQKLLAAHMMGDDAPEIIQGFAIAITAGATKQDVDRTIGIHPTSAEEFVTMRTRTRMAGLQHAA